VQGQPPVHPAEDCALLFDLAAGIAAALQFLQKFVMRDRKSSLDLTKATTGIDVIREGRVFNRGRAA